MFKLFALLGYFLNFQDCTVPDFFLPDEKAVIVDGQWDVPSDTYVAGRYEFPSGGGVWSLQSSEGAYLIIFLDYQTDSQGGAHNFCGPYKLKE